MQKATSDPNGFLCGFAVTATHDVNAMFRAEFQVIALMLNLDYSLVLPAKNMFVMYIVADLVALF